jgi:hypothetical protein
MKNFSAILNDTDDLLAEDSGQIRQEKMKRKAKELAHFGSTKGCHEIIADSGKIRIYIKPSQDVNERLEHYRVMCPDAKIVK